MDVDEAGGHVSAARVHHGQRAKLGVGLHVEVVRANGLDGGDAPVDDHHVVIGQHAVGAHHRAAADDARVSVHGRFLSRVGWTGHSDLSMPPRGGIRDVPVA